MLPARKRFFCAILLVVFCAGCRKDTTVVVHIFHDPAAPYAAQLTRAVEHFHSLKVHATDGKLIVIAEVSGDYKSRVPALGTGLTPDLVFLNSRADAEKNPNLQNELSRAIELGGEGRHFLAFIPSWVSGDELLATRTFLNFLVSSGELW